MSNQQDSAIQSEQGSPKVQLTAHERTHLISSFFTSKGRYPVLTNSLIDEAISLDFLPYDRKDKILRDPNQLTIFLVELNPNSPRTSEAIQMLDLSHEAIHIPSFFDFQSELEHPIKSLITYMQYLQSKYKVLLQIVSLRNKLKKQNNVSNSTRNQISSSIFITENKNLSRLSKSITHRSMEFQPLTYEDRIEQIAQRSTEYLNTLMKQSQISDEMSRKLENYYSQTVPIIAQKVERVKEQHKKEQLQRKQQYRQRHQKTLEKIHKLENDDREHRLQLRDAIRLKFEQQENNKNSLNQSHLLEMQEQQEKNKKKQQDREERRNKAQYLEEQWIEDIVEKNLEKSQLAENCLKKIKQSIKLKKLEQQKKIEIANQKVAETQVQKDTERLQQFLFVANQSTKMVETQMSLRNLKLKELKNKMEKQQQRVQKNKVKILKEFNEKIEEIRSSEESIKFQKTQTISHQSPEIRKLEMDEKNKLKLNRTLRRTQEAEEQKNRWLAKIIHEKQKLSELKQQQEKFKDAVLKHHLEFRNNVDKIFS